MPNAVSPAVAPNGSVERCPTAPLTWLLVGPLGRESASWGAAPQVILGQLQTVQPRASLYELDLPGTGRLWRERTPSQVSEWVEQLRSRVHASGLRGPFGLIASSWASCVAAEWARQHADELGVIVMLSPGMRPFSPVLRSVRPGFWTLALAQVLGRRSPFERDRRYWDTHTQLEHPPAEVLKQWRQLRRAHPFKARNGWRQMLAVWRFETTKRRPHTQVLLLAGKGDVWLDWRVSAAISRAWGAALRVHPEAGHDLLLDDPAWVARSVAEWLMPVGSGSLNST